jgi:hypothetical protein
MSTLSYDTLSYEEEDILVDSRMSSTQEIVLFYGKCTRTLKHMV